MTTAMIRKHVADVLGDPAAWVGVGEPDKACCVEIREALRLVMPDAKIDVYHRIVELVVEVRDGIERVDVVVQL